MDGPRCEADQEAFAHSGPLATASAGTAVDLVNEAVESTLRSSGWEFVETPEPFLEGVGGVGAALVDCSLRR